MLLTDKSIIVTGAGGGIGEAIARVCHREGARVIVADVREDAVRSVAASLGDRARSVLCDVRSDEDLSSLVEQAVGWTGRIDGLVNNAGIDFSKPFLDVTAEDWDRILDTNLRSSFFLTQLVCRRLLDQVPAGGSIVNISSVHSLAGVPGATPYDASKAGMVGMTRAIAVELAARGIRVNCISPGLINTQIWQDHLEAATDIDACLDYWRSNIPIQRVIEPCEIAELTAFLLCDRSACITGTNMVADGGMTSRLLSQPLIAR